MMITSTISQLIFFSFSTVLVICSMMVTLSSRSVFAVLWLILAFVATAGTWILIEAEFLGLILIVVYVGAVMTLFLFVVMMLNLDTETVYKPFSKRGFSFVSIFFILLVILFLLYIAPHYSPVSIDLAATTPIKNNLVVLGLALFHDDALTVELAAVILLVALVSAIYLTHRQHTHRKKQSIADQVQVTKKSRLKIIAMASEQRVNDDGDSK